MYYNVDAKFKIGDRITSNKLGNIILGTIVGMTHPIGLYPEYTLYCDGYYPDWREKFVYNVLFDTPQKVLSFDDFKRIRMNQLNELFGEMDFKEYKDLIDKTFSLSYNQLPNVSTATYPEDDLILLEDIE